MNTPHEKYRLNKLIVCSFLGVIAAGGIVATGAGSQAESTPLLSVPTSTPNGQKAVSEGAPKAYTGVFPDMPALDKLTFPQKRGAVYDEIRGLQGLGKFVVAPHSDFFLFEWQRPYNWAPDNKGLARSAAMRKQTAIYKVVTTFDQLKSYEKTTSEYLFYPAAGATYYLGELSPDSKWVSFYEIDRDDNTIRAGAVLTNDGVSPRIVWLDATPDSAQLDTPPVWLANDELVFPVKKGWVRGKIPEREIAAPVGQVSNNTVGTQACTAFNAPRAPAHRAGHPAMSSQEGKKPPAGYSTVASSQDGRLSIFSQNTPEVLALMFRVAESSDATEVTLFENDKRSQAILMAEQRKAQRTDQP